MRHIRVTSCAKHLPMKACEEGEENGGGGSDLALQVAEFINDLVCEYKPEKGKCAEA